MVGPLLLFYDKVILYGPVGSLVKKAYDDPDLRKTSLTEYEFKSFVEEGLIIPLGFETFFNKDKRQEIYLPDLRVIHEFDKDLLGNGPLTKHRVIVPNNFKMIDSPNIAKRIIDSDHSIKNALLSVLSSERLPKRYIDLKKDISLIPKNIKDLVRHENADDLLPYVVVYDLLNNRHVMKFEGSTNLHSQHDEFIPLYECIHGLEQVSRNNNVNDKILVNVLRECVKHIEGRRLSSEEILEFRMHHRKYFVEYIEKVFKKYSYENDPDKRQERINEELSAKFKWIKDNISVGIEELVSIVPIISKVSKPISAIIQGDRPDSRRRKLDKALRTPLKPADRWLYHFLRRVR